MKSIRFVLILALTLIIAWYFCDLLLIIEFAMKPYTSWGKTIATYAEHIIFAIVPFAATLMITTYIDQRG